MHHDSLLEPDYERSALITIDVQCDTLDAAPLEIPGTSEMLPRLARLLSAFRKAGRHIVHIVRIYRADGANVDLCRRTQVASGAPWLRPHTPGVELAPAILPDAAPRLSPELLLSGEPQELAPREFALYKPRWGAFYQTALEARLRSAGVDTLVFAGANFPNCPRTSIYEASERDFKIVLAKDAVSGLYERGERELAAIGVRLLGVDEIIRAAEDRLARSHA